MPKLYQISTPTNCEVDWMNGSQDMWWTYTQTDRDSCLIVRSMCKYSSENGSQQGSKNTLGVQNTKSPQLQESFNYSTAVISPSDISCYFYWKYLQSCFSFIPFFFVYLLLSRRHLLSHMPLFTQHDGQWHPFVEFGK